MWLVERVVRDSSEPIIDGAKQSHSDPTSVSTLQLKMEMCFELNTCFSWKFLRADERYNYCFRSMCTIWTWTSMNLWANNQVGLIPGGELRHSDLLCGQTRKHGCDLSWTQVKGDKWSLKAFSGPWTSLSTPRGWDENSSQFTTPTPTPPPSFFFSRFFRSLSSAGWDGNTT